MSTCPKVEEWVERSQGKVRTDVAHDKLARAWAHRFGAHFPPSGRDREEVPPGWTACGPPALGHRAGMWLQYDYGDGPVVDGVKTVLFVAGWPGRGSGRDRVAGQDHAERVRRTDVTFRRLGGVPTYVLTDNEKTVTSEHIAGIPVRNRAARVCRALLVMVHTCVPATRRPRAGPSHR